MSFKEFVYFKIFPIINSLLRPLSLKLVTARTPNRNFEEFFRHLASLDYRFKTVVDVGVGNGTESLYRGTTGANYFLVEAVPDNTEILHAIAKRLNAQLFNVAAGKHSGTLDFYRHADTTGSSSLKQLEDNDEINGQLISVTVERLDKLLPHDIAQPCLLKIDTQGAELDVLEGIQGLLSRIDMIILEVSFHEFRQGAPEVATVIGYMDNIGFVPYEILEGHYRSLDNALAQVDIVFVPKNSVLRKEKTFFSAQQIRKYLGEGKV
jgi:FkbM family methyltransferase